MRNKKLFKEILSYVLILLVVLLFRIYLFSPIVVRESSMVPTLHDGDVMILNKIGYRINGLKRFDIIVLRYDGEKLIKRVIGLPGEDIEYIDNELYVNGKKIDEDYTRKETEDFILEVIGYSKIPEDKYLVMGDNRPYSKDSRTIGLIDKKDIVGYANTIIYPFTDIGEVK